jgi:hypothetical protein
VAAPDERDLLLRLRTDQRTALLRRTEEQARATPSRERAARGIAASDLDPEVASGGPRGRRVLGALDEGR